MPTYGLPCEDLSTQPMQDYLNVTIPVMNEIVAEVIRPILEHIDRNTKLLQPIIDHVIEPIKSQISRSKRKLNRITTTVDAQLRNKMSSIERKLKGVIDQLPPGTMVVEQPIPDDPAGGTQLCVIPPAGFVAQENENEERTLPLSPPPPPPPAVPEEPEPSSGPQRYSALIVSKKTGLITTPDGQAVKSGVPVNVAGIPADILGDGIDRGNISSAITKGQAGITVVYNGETYTVGLLSASLATLLRHEEQSRQHGQATAKAIEQEQQIARLPPTPPMLTTFPCPSPPDTLGAQSGVIGSADWCNDTDRLLDWLENLGAKLGEWIAGNVNEQNWERFVDTIVPPIKESGIVNDIIYTINKLLTAAVKIAARGVRTLKDIVSCAMYYAKIITPIQKPNAYVALILIQNIIEWIRNSRIGSQDFLGFTVGTSLRLPQLEAYLDRLLQYLCCIELPSVPEIGEAYLVGLMPHKQYECLLKLNGVDPRLYKPLLEARSERLTTEEAIEYGRRFGFSEDEISKLMRRAGWYDVEASKRRQRLYDELPTVQDHLHWMQKNVFNDEYAKLYKLDEGFDKRFWAKFGAQLFAQGYTEERARYEYMAHWIMPSPTQMREFVYRLRPGRDKGNVTFTVDDYKRILSEQDYNIVAQEWFAATVNPVPALSYLRDMHRMDLLTDSQMREYHKDLGYTDKDSDLFVQVDTYRKRRMRASQGAGWTPAALKKAYSVGQVDDTKVRNTMKFLGFDQSDASDLMERAKADYQYAIIIRARSRLLTGTISTISQALDVGIMDKMEAASALQGIGWTEKQAKGIADIEEAKSATKRVAAVVRSLRHCYAAGECDEAFARLQLGKAGIRPERITQYITQWQLEQTPSRKRATAKDIVEDVARGWLDSAEAEARLRRLGYEDPDIRLFFADASDRTIKTSAALKALNAYTTNQQVAEISKLAEDTIGLSRKVVARWQQMEPPNALLKSLCNGSITPQYVIERLRVYGWDDESIARRIAMLEVKGERCVNPDFIATFFGISHDKLNEWGINAPAPQEEEGNGDGG